MQFVNFDVRNGDGNDHCRVGSLTPGLNAICEPTGASKTNLMEWLSSMLSVDSSAAGNRPAGAQRAAGVIEYRLANELLRLDAPTSNLVHDGQRHTVTTANGFLPVSGNQRRASPMQLRGLNEMLEIASGTSAISRLHALARDLKLRDQYSVDRQGQRQYLQRRQQELQAKLRRLEVSAHAREDLLSQKNRLETELNSLRTLPNSPQIDAASERRRLCDQISSSESEIKKIGRQVEQLDDSISKLKAELSREHAPQMVERVPSSYREQMAELDGQLYRWRQTLREVRAYRDRLDHNATDLRLDRQIGDHISVTKRAEPRVPLRSLEGQILALREQLSGFVSRYQVIQSSDGVAHELPAALLSMQRELYEVCQQLSRHEALTISQTLCEQSAQLARCDSELLQAIEKLIGQRAELLRRIAEEYHLSDSELALAFGDWCECHSHPHLHEWLVSNQGPHNETKLTATEEPLRREIARLEDERRLASTRLEALRGDLAEWDSQLRRLGEATVLLAPARAESEIRRELELLNSDLIDLDSLERYSSELAEIDRRLQLMPLSGIDDNRFQAALDRHLLGLGAEHRYSEIPVRRVAAHRPFASSYLGASRTYFDAPEHSSTRQWAARRPKYEFASSHTPAVSAHREYAEPTLHAPDPVVETALRLAIAQCLAESANSIPVILDSTLDQLPLNWIESAVRHLSNVAREHQQVIILTSNPQVANLVRDLGGNTLQMRFAERAHESSLDINRSLHAFANEHETEKWREPFTRGPAHSPSRRPSGDREPNRRKSSTYLVEASLVDHLPSLPSAAVASLKSLAVNRIGDLLDADPQWLAERLRSKRIDTATVEAWQAEARLLCTVPKLRPFDARVLVGAGIRQPRQLAQMHPSQLLDHVENFLATDRGREILQSGNSYELSRITSWIAAAKNGAASYRRSNIPDTDHDPHHSQSHSAPVSPAKRRQESRVDDSRSRRAGATNPPKRRTVVPSQAGVADPTSVESAWKFYLQLSSPVVDAPSIGPRMAERLLRAGISTVEQLLAAVPETLAERIASKQVTADAIRAWQNQARLVCRIPNLRGHDVQLLVAAGIASADELARMQPGNVLQRVTDIANSPEGQRFLRGNKSPDETEVSEWIRWANHSRSIQAA